MTAKWANVNLSGKVCVITGASDGIGVPTAKNIAKAGAHTILAVRNLEKGQKVADDIIAETGNKNVEVMKLDLSSFESVRGFAEAFRQKSIPLHLLINNAGIFVMKVNRTVDGFEDSFQVNHLSHFLLTNLLLDIIKASAPARIINVSSDAHYSAKEIEWDNMSGEKNSNKSMMHWYEVSKLYNVLFTLELQRRLKEQGVDIIVHSLHPGTMIATNIIATTPLLVQWGTKLAGWLGITKSVEQGSWTTLTAALAPEYGVEGALYLRDSLPVEPSKLSQDKEVAKKLWEVSETFTNLK